MDGAGRRLTDAQRTDWLRLIRTETVGPATFRRLINRFGSAEKAIAALPGLTRAGGAKAPPKIPSRMAVEDELSALAKMKARLIGLGEPDYPPFLKHIAAAPPLIAVLGSAERIDWNRTVGMVGARNASAAGQRLTATLAADLGQAGYTIASGLARGVDAAAHTASLATGTVAVLAGGLNRIYPEQNIPLAARIVEEGGALLTEMPLGWEPRARDFPRRNRLISGLSRGIVIIEAARRSGSLITARYALEQNREVFAIPGSPLDPRAEGGNELIREGAILVTRAEHIVEILDAADPSRLPLAETEDGLFDLDETVPATDPDNDARTRLISALSPTPTPIDDLIRHTGLSVGLVQIILLELDLAQRLEWASGQLVSLKA